MRYSLNSFNHSVYHGLPPTLPAQIAAAAAAGYDHIGLDIWSVLAHEKAGTTARDLAGVIAGSGLTCHELVSLSVSADREATRRSLGHIVRVAREVGASQVLSVVTGPVDDAVVANTAHCARVLAGEGLGYNLEFLPTRDVDSIREARRLGELVAHENFRLVVEAWHVLRGPTTWADLDDLPLSLVGFVQFSDALPMIGDDLHAESMGRRAMPGDGELDLAGFCGALLGKGFDGVVSVEVVSDRWRAAPLQEYARTSLATTRRAWEEAAAALPAAAVSRSSGRGSGAAPGAAS